jgi:hypothetical protein
MTDTTNNAPVRVTAEERPHPALRKLARAVIALARPIHDRLVTRVVGMGKVPVL